MTKGLALAAVGFVLALTACSTGVNGVPQAAEITATTTTVPPTASDSESEPSTTTPTGPPSDAACLVVSWNDLPPDVRHPSKSPEPRPGEDPEIRGCRLDNSTAEVVVRGPRDGTGTRPPPTIDAFIVVVLIGPTLITSPSGYEQGEPVTINDRDGVRKRGTTAGVPWCLVAFPTRTTKAAVEVDNNRFPAFPVCDLATSLAERIAPRVG